MDEFQQQLRQQYQIFADRPLVQDKIQAVLDCLKKIKQQQLPAQPLPVLTFSINAILADPRLMPLDDLFSQLRQYLIVNFGIWSLPNQAFIRDLSAFIHGRPTLEIMAGNALISACLQQASQIIQTTDTLKWQGQDNQSPHPWCSVQTLDALTAVQTIPATVIIMSWAPDTDNQDYQLLNYLRQENFQGDLIVIGEANGATNSADFWQTAQLEKNKHLNQNYRSLDNIQEAVYLVQ
ncbi:SAM-dependent methyltransferase [Convivina intestini]|uniref:SAM-dependent methyltransferase n=1 Tax=Convivina intestini TaxID=1505726 RepID=A0A2U1D944_9LACO|nr:SAM-dependent methyltransferase [Convivina intestini]PVY84149.1 hypothetical protein C7384_10526 [Convivina intestini]CAH1854401.1 hypothetical protein R077811_00895 [Convivina intestini]SDB91286.1 hypothetical protein SAMN05216341_10495 [Leuconostocaceae bacterium R-53105]